MAISAHAFALGHTRSEQSPPIHPLKHSQAQVFLRHNPVCLPPGAPQPLGQQLKLGTKFVVHIRMNSDNPFDNPSSQERIMLIMSGPT
jgi:hypothetical protein